MNAYLATDGNTEVHGIWFAAVFLGLVTILLIVIIVQVGALWRARISIAREKAYQELAVSQAAATEQTAAALEQLNGTVTDIEERLTSVERMMREVE